MQPDATDLRAFTAIFLHFAFPNSQPKVTLTYYPLALADEDGIFHPMHPVLRCARAWPGGAGGRTGVTGVPARASEELLTFEPARNVMGAVLGAWHLISCADVLPNSF